MDVISQEEFDSQRGVESEPADGDMVFALELPPEGATAAKPSAAAEREVEGGARRQEEESKPPAVTQPERQPKADHRGQQTKKPEKRARFYPVPNKKESQEKVGVVVGVSSTAQSACRSSPPWLRVLRLW